MHRIAFATALLLAAITLFPGCARQPACSQSKASRQDPVRIKLATTTSTDSTGLLAVLLPPFEEANNVKVDVIAVGTGKAILLGETGDADVLLAHAREAEDKFIEAGFGVNRRDVMHNDFVVIGPSDDPVPVSGSKSASEAFTKIAAAKAPFISRGDASGTHVKELDVWKSAGVKLGGAWYMEAGQGMMPVLIMAIEKKAYCLCDRASWLAFEKKEGLKIVSQGDPVLFNPYGVIAINPAKHPHVKYMEAMMFIAWVTSIEGQKIIGGFKKHGEVLFNPDAVPAEK